LNENLFFQINPAANFSFGFVILIGFTTNQLIAEVIIDIEFTIATRATNSDNLSYYNSMVIINTIPID